MRNSSYSFIMPPTSEEVEGAYWFGSVRPVVSSGVQSPILLKLYRCCDHALKICMWFGYNPHNESEWAVGTLCAQLLLQFHANSFKTLHVLWAWSEDMHVVGICSSD